MSLYKAMSEEDVMKARFNLLEDGEYDAVVKVATPSMSKSQNAMADMTLAVFDKMGNAHDIRDFLVFTPNMLWKVKHFCDSAGLEQLYLDEKFTPEHAANQHVRVKVKTQQGNEIPFDKLNGKPVGSKYPDKNVIEDYVIGKSNVIGKPEDEFINDAIPF